jgi:hypothetical protein
MLEASAGAKEGLPSKQRPSVGMESNLARGLTSTALVCGLPTDGSRTKADGNDRRLQGLVTNRVEW